MVNSTIPQIRHHNKEYSFVQHRNRQQYIGQRVLIGRIMRSGANAFEDLENSFAKGKNKIFEKYMIYHVRIQKITPETPEMIYFTRYEHLVTHFPLDLPTKQEMDAGKDFLTAVDGYHRIYVLARDEHKARL